MDSRKPNLTVYRELADWYEQHRQVPMRDRFLILAADAALSAGQPEEAERLRQHLLRDSRAHMLKPYASFAEAAQVPDVQTYIRDLRSNYPVEVATDLLKTLQATEGSAAAPLQPEPKRPAQASPIPPTAPVIDLDRGPSAPRAGPAKPPAARPEPRRQPDVFRPLDEPPPPLAAPVAPQRSARPAAPGTTPYPLAPEPVPARPVPARPTSRPPAATAGPAPAGRTEPRRPRRSGAWLCWALAVLVALAALAWAALTLAHPFLPAGWLP